MLLEKKFNAIVIARIFNQVSNTFREKVKGKRSWGSSRLTCCKTLPGTYPGQESYALLGCCRACRESGSVIRNSNLYPIFLENRREKVDSNLFFEMMRFANQKSTIFYLIKIRESLMIRIKIRIIF